MSFELLRAYLFALIGRTHRYHYGGKEPIQGFDCSGLACEVLMAVGALPFGSVLNAQALYDHFKAQGQSSPALGSLAFFGKDEHTIDHVGICLDATLMVEAGGGDSSVTSDLAAIAKHAFVKMRPMRYRRDFLFCVMPPYANAVGPQP